MEYKSLRHMDHTFNETFNLALEQGEVFEAESVLRVMPNKRLVVLGTWHNKKVVAKIFFEKNRANCHMQQELNGVKQLQDYKVPTPDLLYYGCCQDKRISILIFEYIDEAKNLENLWQTMPNKMDLLISLKSVMIELATQHVLGIIQEDLHLKNFLLTHKKIYTLDAAQIEFSHTLLSKKISMQYLALLLSQLGAGLQPLQDSLFKHYAKARGWSLKESDFNELHFLIRKCDEKRWLQFEEKIFRNCTAFKKINTWQQQGMYDQAYFSEDLMRFIHQPDSYFKEETEYLKKGRSATVIKIQMGEQWFVVKRYNLKHIWHRLRRTLRETRAAKSWRFAQKMRLFNIPTAKPVAFIEKRFFGLRGASYYLTEYVQGEDIQTFFQRNAPQSEETQMGVQRISALLKSIRQIDLTHGDLKSANILFDEHGFPLLIDLDGAASHSSFLSLRRAWFKEIERFLHNFHTEPELAAQFKNALS